MKRAKRPPRTCDAPRCDAIVAPGKLMCRSHWFATPRPLRQAINDAWRERRMRDWSANILEARAFHADVPPSVSSQEAYARTAAMMGERE